jgi:hypothetical protein
MTKLAYLSSTALCALALVAGVSPAAADGAAGGWGNQLYGRVNLAYDWTMYNPNAAPDFHTHTFIGQGALGVPLGNGWSAEGNFSFESQQFNSFSPKFSVDTWQVGGLVGYRFDGEGRIGFDLAYQTVDFGLSVDGYRAGARGELFWRPDVTFRAAAGYQNYDTSGIKADGFYGSAGGSYYFSRNIGFRGNVDYFTYNLRGFGPSSDYNVWDFGGKLQYKCDTYPFVFGAHADYATVDAFGTHGNDAWNLGIDFTALFGIGAQDSSLRDAEVNAPFESMRTGVKYLF